MRDLSARYAAQGPAHTGREREGEREMERAVTRGLIKKAGPIDLGAGRAGWMCREGWSGTAADTAQGWGRGEDGERRSAAEVESGRTDGLWQEKEREGGERKGV